MTSRELLVVEHITAGYDPGTDIISDVSFTLAAGAVLSLVGPNGCGKSTALRCLAGKLKPRKGTIRLRGSELRDYRPDLFRQKGITYAPQDRPCFDSLTVGENLDAAGYQLGNKKDLSSWVSDIWARFPELAKLRTSRAGNLSGGERKLLSIAMALLPGTKILVLDEPTASLSTRWIKDLEDVLGMLLEEKWAVIMAEQNVGFAARLADEVLIMRQGRIDEKLTGEAFGNFLRQRKKLPGTKMTADP